MSALCLFSRLGRTQLRLLQRSPALVARPPGVPSLTLARIPYARGFSAPATPATTTSQLEHPEDEHSRRQLEAGNAAEAYGLSPDAGMIGESGVLKKYGIYPIAAAALAIAISKELIIMNEEVILAGCFLASAISGYVALREPITQGFEERRTEVRQLLETSYDARIALEKERYNNALKLTGAMEEMNQFVEEVVAWKKSVYERIPKIAEAQVRAEVAKGLQELHEYETKIVANYHKDFVTAANAYVRKAIRNADKSSKEAVLEGAIEELRTGKRKKRVGSPQVLALYKEYFKMHKPNWEAIIPKDTWWQHMSANLSKFPNIPPTAGKAEGKH